jgi:tRNA threonylcarbamoyladenosine biosynthesis protein TsaE
MTSNTLQASLGRASFLSRDPEDTAALARALIEALDDAARERGLTLALLGDLGAGKTVFAKALAGAMGIDPGLVSSPTFVIANQYRAPNGWALNHVDFYRLEREAELAEFGFDDLLERGALVAVEWAERFPAALPADRLNVRIVRDTEAGPEVRRLRVEAAGPHTRAILAAWKAAVGGEREPAI